MKKIVSLMSAALLVMSANAATITSVDKDIVNATVTVKGEGMHPNETAGIWVTYPSVASVTDGKQSNTIAYVGEVKADSDGDFKHDILMPESTNKQVINFDVKLVSPDGTKETAVLKYIDNDGLEQTLLNIKQSKDSSEMYGYFAVTAEALDVKLLEPWTTLKNQSAVLNGAYSVRDSFDSFTSVQNELNYRILQCALSEAETTDEFYALIDKYDSMVDSTLFDEGYNDMPAEVLSDFKTRFFDNRNALDGSADSLKYTLRESVLLSYVAKLDRNAPLIKMLENYADVLIHEDSSMKSVMDEYKKDDAKKIDVCNALLKDRTTTISAMNTVIKAAFNDDDNGGSGNSSGGSSNGRSTSMSVDSGFVPGTVTDVPSSEFADLRKEHFAYNAVDYLTKNNVINGYFENSTKLFKPQNEISREEFLKLVYTAFDFEISDGENGFADVVKDSWYEKFVISAANDGIVNGIGEGIFGTGRQITREDMAVMIYRVLQKKGTALAQSQTSSFADDALIADYAKEAVNYLKSTGIVSGDESGSFNPKSNATRGEAAKILYEIVIRMGGKN